MSGDSTGGSQHPSYSRGSKASHGSEEPRDSVWQFQFFTDVMWGGCSLCPSISLFVPKRDFGTAFHSLTTQQSQQQRWDIFSQHFLSSCGEPGPVWRQLRTRIYLPSCLPRVHLSLCSEAPTQNIISHDRMSFHVHTNIALVSVC